MFICGRMFLASISMWYPTKLLLWVSATPGEEEPQAPLIAGDHFLKSSFAWKELGVLVDTNLNMSQQHALAPKKASAIPGCMRSAASSLRVQILYLCSALVRSQLELWVWFWASQGKRDMDMLERACGGPWRWLRIWLIS